MGTMSGHGYYDIHVMGPLLPQLFSKSTESTLVKLGISDF